MRSHAAYRGILAALIGLTTLTLLGFMGGSGWVFDLMSHFRMQYLALAVILFAVAAVCIRSWLLVLACLVPLLINATCVAPLFLPRAMPAGGGGTTPSFTLLHMNVLGHNSGYEHALKRIRETAPDLILIEELTDHWLEQLQAGLPPAYAHSLLKPRRDNFGIGLFSKKPLLEAEVLELGSAGVPTLQARFMLNGATISLLATHPVPPIGARMTRLRNEQLQALSAHIRGVSGPLLLVGDLNASRWSQPFRMLQKETGLHDSALGRGWQPTWPTTLPLLGIPIDHALHTPDLQTLRREILGEIGSDHRPLLVEIGYEVPAGRPEA